VEVQLTLHPTQIEELLQELSFTGLNIDQYDFMSDDDKLRVQSAINTVLHRVRPAGSEEAHPTVPITVVIDVPDTDKYGQAGSNIAELIGDLTSSLSDIAGKLGDVQMALDSNTAQLAGKLDEVKNAMPYTPAMELGQIRASLDMAANQVVEAMALGPSMGAPEATPEVRTQMAAAKVLSALERRPDLMREIHRLLDERGTNGAATA